MKKISSHLNIFIKNNFLQFHIKPLLLNMNVVPIKIRPHLMPFFYEEFEGIEVNYLNQKVKACKINSKSALGFMIMLCLQKTKLPIKTTGKYYVYLEISASIPNWAWSIFKPIDKAFIADLIHDALWIDKQGQIKHFDNNIYQARKFADEERLRWRKALAPDKKIKNYVTHKIIRLIGGFYYSRQINIPS